MSGENKKAFSLLELIVVIATLSLLMGILIPTLATSRSQVKQIQCGANIRQLLFANIAYANSNNDYYVPAAPDIFSTNLYRWYGVRNDTSSPFDSTKGPLATYLGGGFVDKCPQKVNFARTNPSNYNYDEGAKGYGYNMIYIGSRLWTDEYEDKSCTTPAKNVEVRRPADTLMFTDTAMATMGNGKPYYLECSFAEPRYFVINRKPEPIWDPFPSIHFRHRGYANVGWVDGHVSSKKMAKFNGVNSDGVKPAEMNLGWFEPMDNSMFDLE